MNSLEIAIKVLTKELKRFNDNLPHLQKEMSKTETVKRLNEEKQERFERMKDFPRVELEEDQVHSI